MPSIHLSGELFRVPNLGASNHRTAYVSMHVKAKMTVLYFFRLMSWLCQMKELLDWEGFFCLM